MSAKFLKLDKRIRRDCLLQEEIVWLVYGFVVSLKCLLIRCYHSTDFEVHRNWMAITYHLPISEWYFSNVSEWTLDYPPFFAYFEKGLSVFANCFDPQILSLQSGAYFTENTLIFQRFSVIVGDVVYAVSSAFLAKNLTTSISWLKNKPEFTKRFQLGIFLLLLINPSLILLDNVHFQYNSFLYGILFTSIAFILSKNYLKGAFIFAVLLNFKHIFLYYVPAFVFFYSFYYLLVPEDRSIKRRAALLFFVLLFPLFVSFGPFLFTGGVPVLTQILQRLFPFKRGLTHAYWAPNFWALYNFIDFILYKILSNRFVKSIVWQPFKLNSPQYTKGIVAEYDHSVLPNVNPQMSLYMILLSLIPVLFMFIRKKVSSQNKLLIGLTLSSYGFFLFGWHVHEKALLMVFFPALLLLYTDLKFCEGFHYLCFTCTISMFPLFFTPLENFLKYGLGIGYLITHFSIIFYVFKLLPLKICSQNEFLFLMVIVGFEFYNSFVHKLVFGSGVDFLPLMIFSVLCSVGVLISYLKLLYLVFGENIRISLAKRQCLREEKYIDDDNKLISDVSLIGGIDISACSDNPLLAICSLTVLDYNSLKIVDILDEVVLLPFPYIPEFLAIREAHAMANLVVKFSLKFKKKLNAIFVDGNGKFHSRLRGLAVHVGSLSNTVSIGVAKKLAAFPRSLIDDYVLNEISSLGESIKSECKHLKLYADFLVAYNNDELFKVFKPLGKKNLPLYISAGYGINLNQATNLAANCCTSTVVNPIRIADLRSRSLLKEFYNK